VKFSDRPLPFAGHAAQIQPFRYPKNRRTLSEFYHGIASSSVPVQSHATRPAQMGWLKWDGCAFRTPAVSGWKSGHHQRRHRGRQKLDDEGQPAASN
jgi:hypothetical protein